MWEFIKTGTGWSVFWGIDPEGGKANAAPTTDPEEPMEVRAVLPFRQSESEPKKRPAA
jgi:hypothetical protein